MNKFLLFIFLVCIFGCGSDDEKPYPETFNVIMDNIDFDSVTINWNSFSNETVFYDVVLSDKIITSEITSSNFVLTALKPGTEYTGKVIAKFSNGNRSIGEFNFKTKGITGFEPYLDKQLLDLDNNTISAIIKWDHPSEVPDGVTPTYDVFLNGNKYAWGRHYTSIEINSLKANVVPYRVSVVLKQKGYEDIIKEISFNTPTDEELNGLNFKIETTYRGYTAINFKFDNLNSVFKNSLYKTGSNLILENDELLVDNITIPEVLLPNFPLNIIPDYSEEIVLKAISLKTSKLGAKRKLNIKTRNLRLLPQDDLFAEVFNVSENSVNIAAANTSRIIQYDTSFNGPESFNIYLNDEFLGSYQCYFYGGGASGYIPPIKGLSPGSTYKIKVEVDYNNAIPNPIYEPNFNIPLTTYKEFEITTYSEALKSDLEVEIENITASTFDLNWRTDISSLYTCYYGTYGYRFRLELNGVQYWTFSAHQNPVTINKLEPNKVYNAKLICDYYYPDLSNILDTRTAEFTIQTLQ